MRAAGFNASLECLGCTSQQWVLWKARGATLTVAAR